MDQGGIVCPYLGLADDRATHYAFPSPVHRCNATREPTRLDNAKQALDCLTSRHVTCPRYLKPAARPLHDTDRSRVDHMLDPGAGPRAWRMARRLARVALLVIATLVIVMVALALVAVLTGQLSGRVATVKPGIRSATSPVTRAIWPLQAAEWTLS